ncbi:MAG: hypothetical protein RIK87_10940 [Fuerstiella sp.]
MDRRGVCLSALILWLTVGTSLPLRGQITDSPLTIPSLGSDYSEGMRADVTDSDPADFEISLRTDLLDSFVSRQTVESDDVATQVLEADVRGVQTTTTSIRVQSVDSQSVARLDLLATGVVSSSTVGITPQARVATTGNHTFDIRKPVFFDGRQFLTKPAFGSVRARQFPQAVQTLASGVPLFGPIGERIAWNEVYRRMPMSDAVVVRQVADDVLPKVNRGVDSELIKLNQQWHRFRQMIDRAAGSDSVYWNASTTSTALMIAARNPAARSPGTGRWESPVGLRSNLEDDEAVAMIILDAAVNRMLEQQPWGGLTVSDSALQNLFQAAQAATDDPQQLLTLLMEPAQQMPEPTLFSVRLADQAPLTLLFHDGSVTISLKFQVVPKSASPGQLQLLNVRFAGQSEADGTWSVAVKQISAQPADPGELPDAWTTLISNQAAVIADRVPPSRLPRVIDLQFLNDKLPLLRIRRIQTAGGWLRASWQIEESAEQLTRCLP